MEEQTLDATCAYAPPNAAVTMLLRCLSLPFEPSPIAVCSHDVLKRPPSWPVWGDYSERLIGLTAGGNCQEAIITTANSLAEPFRQFSVAELRPVVIVRRLVASARFEGLKYIDATNAAKSAIVTRIHALGALLSAANPAELHRLPCFGTFDDLAYEQASKGNRRIGLVYSVPRGVQLDRQSSPSLLRLIRQRSTRPPLGARLELARRLAGAVALLHAANWLHKSLRSDNILFSGKGVHDAEITAPYICGFQYSRPGADTSIESRPLGMPELDVYYHPDVDKGWNKVREVYSLGIVLLEVALWRPVFVERYKTMTMAEMSKDILTELDGKFGRGVVGLVGTAYVDVVKCCLKGEFGVTTGNSRQEGKVLSKSFWQNFVEPLAGCKA
ncbi:hypothetical protein BKA56DRAFT_725919 [Ilyonectria sp. MPI-CAGE-AT-0026]|nr:hypothetical protein BKA56DRAFT_725919 [Ilyonectria sp. MPI-CAGE-AT-0026]